MAGGDGVNVQIQAVRDFAHAMLALAEHLDQQVSAAAAKGGRLGQHGRMVAAQRLAARNKETVGHAREVIEFLRRRFKNLADGAGQATGLVLAVDERTTKELRRAADGGAR